MNRYLVILLRKPHVDPAMVSAHRDFLAELRAQGRNEMNGPFGDGSGGAYLLRANDLDEAMAIVQRDPAHTSGGWEITVHEWQAS
ncbi:YciI family protein [Rhodanobacter koreensis]